MSEKKILYTSEDVRNAVIHVLSSKKRRIVITAFVGEGAEDYIPNPKGVEVICWPKPGGTNPNTLRKLLRKGVKISFSDLLHMKVYWSEDRGAFITSANLTTNALGSGGLKELGVYLDSADVDIDNIIRYLKPKKISQIALERLDRQHVEYYKNNPSISCNEKQDNFKEWSEIDNEFKRRWKLGWWDGDIGVYCKDAITKTQKLYPQKEPSNYIPGRKDDFYRYDWVLCFRLRDNKKCSNFEWLYVDFISKSVSADGTAYDKDYPMQAIQILPLKRYTAPPFKLGKKFKKAFSQVVEETDIKKLKKDVIPSDNLVEQILEHYS